MKIQNPFKRPENLRETAVQAALLVFPPVTAFYLMQFVYGASPWETAPMAAFANILCIGVIHLLFCAVTGHFAACALGLHVLCGFLGAANYFVSVYRGTPVLPWDLTALGTAFDVSGSYSFVPTWRMTAGIAMIVLLAWGLRRELPKGRLMPRRHSLPVRLFLLTVSLFCLLPAVRPDRLRAFGVETDVWNQIEAYKENGILASFLRNTEFMEVEKPEGASPERAKELLSGAEQPDLPEISVSRPNIIAIMNESWADFEEFGSLELTKGVLDGVKSLDNAIFGHAYTSVFGAGTSASEFEFLTGSSMAFLPSGSIPYQQYILEDSPSLAWLLKEQGYDTMAFHPGEQTSWQRNLAYPRLGFDEFLSGDDMTAEKTEEHGYVSDAADFSQIIQEFENKEAGEPFFLFNVTIQNHGSYTVKDYPAQVRVAGAEGKYPMAEQYLTLAEKTDEAFCRLADYFSDFNEPVLILMFGDHQPSVEQEFLDLAYGVKQEDMTMEQYMGKYRVPFVIWANYPLPQEELADTSLNFLAQYVLRYAGLESSAYGNWLWEFQKELPAMTFVGYTDRSGKAYSHLETNGYAEKIKDYSRLQYVRLFGSEE